MTADAIVNKEAIHTYEDLKNVLALFSEKELKMNISICIDDEYISGASGFIASLSDGDVLEAGHPYIQTRER